jgi:Fe-S cluster assembly scaffold protein SufB
MIFYMQQRGLTEAQAMSLAVNGFINDLAREFPRNSRWNTASRTQTPHRPRDGTASVG